MGWMSRYLSRTRKAAITFGTLYKKCSDISSSFMVRSNSHLGDVGLILMRP